MACSLTYGVGKCIIEMAEKMTLLAPTRFSIVGCASHCQPRGLLAEEDS